MKTISLYWCRRDFRMNDNPALRAAVASVKQTKGFFLPVFILEDYMTKEDTRSIFGYPQKVFLSKALSHFASQFKHFLILEGKASNVLITLVKKLQQEDYTVTVFVNDDIHPDFYKQIKKLTSHNVTLSILPDQLSIPKNLTTKEGSVYSIFTPFKKASWKDFLSVPVVKKPTMSDVEYLPEKNIKEISSDVVLSEESIFSKFASGRTMQVLSHDGNHLKKHIIDLANIVEMPDISSNWYFSEQEAMKRFSTFVSHNLHAYHEKRDSLEGDVAGNGATSRMSLALAWGLVSARMLRDDILQTYKHDISNLFERTIHESEEGLVAFMSELMWREFYKYLLYHRPELLNEEFQARFRNSIRWVPDSEAIARFQAWIQGNTGYDIVDAAMKQLSQTGWMHNRARMIAASVLTKNLGVDWRWGQEYFRAQLVDLDDASNNGGWQWGASVGADPKPIRIFNPTLQAESHDKSGAYRKQWLGEERYFFNAIPPIVDHAIARTEALQRYGLHGTIKPRDY